MTWATPRKPPSGARLTGAARLSANVSVTTVPPLLADAQAYVDLQRGMFIHWSMATFVGTEFVDPRVYLSDTFNPSGMDIEQWATVAADFGCTYAVLTIKHRDGFCLWPTATTTRGIASSSWYAANGNPDVTQIFCNEFRIRGILPCFYFSIGDTDFTYAHSGGSPAARKAAYRAFTESQITEVLTRYAPIASIWLDSTFTLYGDAYPWDSSTQRNAFIRSVSPGIIIVDNSHTYSFTESDIIEYETEYPPGGNTAPCEMCFSLGGPTAWFWKADDEPLMSAHSVAFNINFVNANNGTCLVNVSPNTVGIMPAQFVTRLGEALLLLGASSTPVSPNNMTSDSAPTPYVASALSVYPGGYEAYRAFDSSPNTFWNSGTGMLPEWIKIDLGISQTVSRYSVQARSVIAYHQWTEWTLSGSDNGTDWVDVDSRTDTPALAGEIHFYDLASPETYRYWRWTITNSNSGNYAECTSIALYNA